MKTALTEAFLYEAPSLKKAFKKTKEKLPLLAKQLTVTVQMLAHRAAAVRLCHQDSQMSASATMTSSVVTVYSESLHFYGITMRS